MLNISSLDIKYFLIWFNFDWIHVLIKSQCISAMAQFIIFVLRYCNTIIRTVNKVPVFIQVLYFDDGTMGIVSIPCYRNQLTFNILVILIEYVVSITYPFSSTLLIRFDHPQYRFDICPVTLKTDWFSRSPYWLGVKVK